MARALDGGDHLLATRLGQVVREKAAVTDNQSKCHLILRRAIACN
jgi:hypothetical protein